MGTKCFRASRRRRPLLGTTRPPPSYPLAQPWPGSLTTQLRGAALQKARGTRHPSRCGAGSVSAADGADAKGAGGGPAQLPPSLDQKCSLKTPRGLQSFFPFLNKLSRA